MDDIKKAKLDLEISANLGTGKLIDYLASMGEDDMDELGNLVGKIVSDAVYEGLVKLFPDMEMTQVGVSIYAAADKDECDCAVCTARREGKEVEIGAISLEDLVGELGMEKEDFKKLLVDILSGDLKDNGGIN